LPVILIVGVFTGLVLGLQGYYVLNRFEGVSLVANYRGQLDAQFRKGGAAGVVSSLEQSVARSK
jgi:hypothetical protein